MKPVLNEEDWRYRGQLKSLWLCILEILLMLALPAWVSSSASFHRGAIQWRWRVSWQHIPSFLKCSGPSHAMNSSHANFGRACLSFRAHGWKGKGVGGLRTLVQKLVAVILVGYICGWRSGIPSYSLWVYQLEFRVDTCRCDASKGQCWSFNSSEFYGEG